MRNVGGGGEARPMAAPQQPGDAWSSNGGGATSGGADYAADYDPESYPDYPDGETPVNDAANFNKRQGEMATSPAPPPVGAPAAPLPPAPPANNGGGGNGNGGGGGKGGGKRRKAGRKGGAVRRQQRPRQLNLRNPLGPSLRVAVAQAQPARRKQGKRKQDPDTMPALGNLTAVNNTNSGTSFNDVFAIFI